MAPNSPKMVTLIVLVNLPFIFGYSFNAFVGQQRALQQQQITGIIRSKAAGPIQNQVYYSSNADIAKSTYESNPATSSGGAKVLFQEGLSNGYQKSPYFTNLVNFQPTPYNNHHQNGFKYNGVYYTSNANTNDNSNNILSNQQIANAPVVTDFNSGNNQVFTTPELNLKIGNALLRHPNSNSNLNIQNFDNQNIIHQLNNNNPLNSQNQIPNNQFLYNQLPNTYANNYHFHPAIANPTNNGVLQHPGLFRTPVNNYGSIQNSGISTNQENKPVLPQGPTDVITQNQINPQGISQNQINPQGIPQNQLNPQGIQQNQINSQGVLQNQLNPLGIPQNQINHQNEINPLGIAQNQIKTQPILKYQIPSQHFQNHVLGNQQTQLGSPGVFHNSGQLPQHQVFVNQNSIAPQHSPQAPPPPAPFVPNDQFYPHPALEPVHNNSIYQTVPETGFKPERISGAILGQTREISSQNPIEPLQTLSSQEISDAEFYSKQEPPQFPPLMDQGDIDNEEFRRRGFSNRANQPGRVQLEPVVQNPDVPPECAYNNAAATELKGENCIEIK